MKLTIIYFAGLVDDVGLAEEALDIPLPGLDVTQLASFLMDRHDRLRLEAVRFAVNEEFVDEDHVLTEGDVVALIPPVSGG